MKLSLRELGEEMPTNTADFLRYLHRRVCFPRLGPGEVHEQAIYQTGARDLVDRLIREFETDGKEENPSDEKWYAGDPELVAYIEGTK